MDSSSPGLSPLCHNTFNCCFSLSGFLWLCLSCLCLLDLILIGYIVFKIQVFQVPLMTLVFFLLELVITTPLKSLFISLWDFCLLLLVSLARGLPVFFKSGHHDLVCYKNVSGESNPLLISYWLISQHLMSIVTVCH